MFVLFQPLQARWLLALLQAKSTFGTAGVRVTRCHSGACSGYMLQAAFSGASGKMSMEP